MHLNNDLILRIGYTDPQIAVKISQLNKELRTCSDQLLKDQYQKIIGEMRPNLQPDKTVLARLISCAEKQPNAAVNHNTYKAPLSFFERLKWRLGIENALDKEVQQLYDENIRILENTQATSIIQLKNQIVAFWHVDRQMKDYIEFKANERAQFGLIGKIFFWCLGSLCKLFWNSSVLQVGEKLADRSRKMCAKIGGFTLNGTDYDAVAFHAVGDEKSATSYTTYRDATHRQFDSLTYGKTYIGFIERGKPFSKELLNSNPVVGLLIAREEASRNGEYMHEGHADSDNSTPVLKNRCCLEVEGRLNYRGGTRDAQGSDRLLDQKLTQIMVEMMRQDKKILLLKVDSNYDDLPVLTAGGFENHEAQSMMQELNDFRSKEGNKLYPPYQDYSTVRTRIKPENLDKPNVFYSRGAPKSWSEVIEQEPILSPDAGILPDYWSKKPNLVER